MFCQNCGTKNKPGAKFCRNCGTALRQPTTQPTPVTSQNASTAPQPAPKQPDPKQTAPVEPSVTREEHQAAVKRKKRTGWLWITAGIILAIGFVGFFIYKNNPTILSGATHSDQAKVASSKSASSASTAPQKKTSSAPTKKHLAFPKSTVEGTIQDAFGDISGDTAVYVSPVDSDTEVDSNDQPQRAASDIKLFVMIAAYQQVKDGELSLSDDYTLTDSDKVDGTGKLREMADGTKISIKDLIGYMMEDSDNTAANIMIRKLGGMAAVNHQIDKMGATDTKLERMLMDTDALEDGKDNYTSAKDLGTALKKIYNHQMVSRKYDEEMLTILKQNENHTKLPHDLPAEATVYNKTGEFDDYGVENDAAIFGNQKGAFVIVVMSQDGQRDEQINAMNSFGSVMYKGLLE